MAQYGFFFDQGRCTACQACVLACKSWNDISPGAAKPLRLFEYEVGTFPDVGVRTQWVTCYHCANPICIDASKANGLYKEEKYGAVLLDPQKANNVRDAAAACPYGAISYSSDAYDATGYMCNMCIDRLEQGLLPLCVASCNMRALDFGELTALQAKYGTANTLPDLPDPSIVKPSVVFKARKERKKVVVYDSTKALALMPNRDPLPSLYSSPSDATANASTVVKRNKPVLKPSNADEALRTTLVDEG